MEQRQDRAENIPVVIYTPESRLRQPGVLLQEIWTDLKMSRELAWQLFQRQFGTRYRQTALGPLWVLIPPVFTALIAMILRGSNIVAVSPDEVLPYPLKVFFATIVWSFFARSVALPLQAMRESLIILRTMRVSVEGFLMAKVGEVLFDQSFQFLVLGGVLLLGRISISFAGLIGAIGLLLIMMAFGMSLGFFIVPIGSLYLDVNQALPMILRLWFFLTPVIYDLGISEDSPYSFILRWNPVTPLLQGVIDVSLGKPLVGGWSILVVSIITLILFALGWLIYRVSIPLLVER